MKIGKFDGITGEQIVLDASDEEIKIREAEIAKCIADKKLQEEEAAKLRNVKISAYTKLGLTAEEIESLLPTPKSSTAAKV